MLKRLFILITAVLMSTVYAQEEITVLNEDFGDGNANNWEYDIHWEVILDDGNYVLHGFDDGWLISPMQFLPNVTYKFRYKTVAESGFHFNALMASNRYYFPIHPEFVQLFTDLDRETPIADVEAQLAADEWHNAEIRITGNNLKLIIDDNLFIDNTDESRSIIRSKFSLESGPGTYFDDIVVTYTPVEYDQVASWVRTGGPLGGIGYDVRIDPEDPNIIYVTDQWAGVHKSFDGGKTWVPRNNGIYSRFGPTGDSVPIFCLTIDHNDPNIVWAGTFGMRGVYKSTDKGESWKFSGNGIPNVENLTFRSFAIEPGNSDVVYCGCEWGLYEGLEEGRSSTSRGKVYKTTDGGTNWLEVLDADALFRTVIIDPNNTDIVYAATGIFDRDNIEAQGIWKSTDAGGNWFHINTGITNLTIGDIEMDPDDSNVLLAGAGRLQDFAMYDENTDHGEILRTTNGGESWTQVFDPGEEVLFTYIEFDENNPNNVYAAAGDRGFFKSTDRGLTWFETTYNPPYINPGHLISIATHPSRPNWLMTNSYIGGVFESYDGAQTWQNASKGYTGSEIIELAVNPDDPMNVYVCARSGVFKTTDGGINWIGIGNQYLGFNNVPTAGGNYISLEFSPDEDEVVYFGGEFGIFRLTNGGFDWEHIYELQEGSATEMSDIKVAPSNSNVIYAGNMTWNGYTIDRQEGFDPTDPGNGMIKSTDKGNTWTTINNGLESSRYDINSIAIDPTDEDVVYIATLNAGIYKSTNGGTNWVQKNNGISHLDTRVIVVDPENINNIYVGAQRGGIYKSTDAGETWTKNSLGLDPEAAVRSIQIDQNDSAVLYAGDWLSGVYMSTDFGETWKSINDQLHTRSVHTLALSADSKHLYAGTQGEGVFRMSQEDGAPVVQTIIPSNASKIYYGTDVEKTFQISAYDFNGDDLTYTWYFDNVIDNDITVDEYLINTANITEGDHELKCVVSDGTNIENVIWEMNVDAATSVEGESLPVEYSLSQNYPNPFNPSTVIRYGIPAVGDAYHASRNVTLKIYDILGNLIATLQDGSQAPGYYERTWNASNISSGIYFYKLEAGSYREIKKMILLK